MKRVDYTFEVKWGDTDAAAIVFYPNFYKWMNEASHYYLAEIGYKTSDLFKLEEKIGVPILESTCKFSTPLFFEDMVTVTTTVIEVRNKVYVLEHIFKREDTVVAEGREVRAWTSFKDKPRAVPIPDDVRQAMEQRV